MKWMTLVIAAIAMLYACGNVANAALELRISDGVPADTVDITDNGSGDADSTIGVIHFQGAVGSWNINMTTGLGSVIQGPGSLDLNSIDHAANSSAGTLTIQFTQTDSSPSFPGWRLDWGGTIATGWTATGSAYESNSNAAFAEDNQIGSTLTATPIAFSASTAGSVPSTAPYSLTEKIIITSTGTGTYSGDMSLSPLPEPVSLAIWSVLGMAGLVVARRRQS